MLNKWTATKELGGIIKRPTKKREVIVYGPWKVANVAIEIDNNRVECIRLWFETNLVCDLHAVLIDLSKVTIFEIFCKFTLAELCSTPGFCNKWQMSKSWQGVAEALVDKGLSRCIGEVFLCSNDMTNLHIMIINNGCEVI